MTSSLAQVLVVAHTHWDREWYHTAERFRQRLVALVDELLDAPPAPGTSFLLDGQAVLLDDYLAVRPERAAELSALLRDGRVEAGPWYVLADELIPSGEALVRNLLAGRDAVRRLRGEPPPVLYCPDSFGHPAILPELAAGFGCALVILWRGYGGARWPAGDMARWAGPTGAGVLLHHLPPDGYEFGSSLPHDDAGAAARWARIAEVLLPRATTGVTVLLNGADHHARQRAQAEAVAALARAAGPARVAATSLRDAAAAMAAVASTAELPVVRGELRDSYGYTWTLGGTLATRAAQKRRNAMAERTLVRDVEPWIALGGGTVAIANLRAAWRDLLRGHPHDTLCGTSIDAVADALDHRLGRVEAQAVGLRADAVAALLGHDADAARQDPAAWRPALVLRNPLARTRGGVALMTVARKLADVAVGPGSGSRQGIPVEPATDLPAAGLQVLSRARRVALTEAPRAYPKADLVEEVQALTWVPTLGGYAVQSLPLDALAFAPAPHPVRVEGRAIANEALRIEVGDDGAIRLEERSGTRVVEGLVGFDLERDVGDLYTPAIRERLPAFVFEGCDVVHRGPLRGELALRYRDADGAGTLVLHAALDAGLAAARLTVRGVSARNDARLRVRIASDARPAPPTGKLATTDKLGDTEPPRDASFPRTIADAAFHPVGREPLVVPAADAAMEHPMPTAPLHRYVSHYGTHGMTVVSDGLAEYESTGDGGIAVTLWRAVGDLSRADLPERPGHAGWPAATPTAQCHGPYEAQLAVALHGPDTPAQRDAIERLADDVLLPLTGETLRSNLSVGGTFGGLELLGDGLAFSAAMPARRDGWIALRCVNRRAHPVSGTWRFTRAIAEACLARLDETPGAALRTSAGAIHFEAAPMAIVTILARLA